MIRDRRARLTSIHSGVWYELHHGRRRSGRTHSGRLFDGLLGGDRRRAVAVEDVLRTASAGFRTVGPCSARGQRLLPGGDARVRRSRRSHDALRRLADRKQPRPADVRLRQQRLRLAVRLLVLSTTFWERTRSASAPRISVRSTKGSSRTRIAASSTCGTPITRTTPSTTPAATPKRC